MLQLIRTLQQPQLHHRTRRLVVAHTPVIESRTQINFSLNSTPQQL
jgi:hypothetical protein